MLNQAYVSDPPPYYNGAADPPPPSKEASAKGQAYNRWTRFEKRVGMAEAMDELREKIGPDAFSAPLNQGELTTCDQLSLAFLILFPCVWFAIGVILTSVLRD